MDLSISNFTYVSTQTLQNAFPEQAEQRPPQTTSQPVAAPTVMVQAGSKKQTTKTERRKT